MQVTSVVARQVVVLATVASEHRDTPLASDYLPMASGFGVLA